MARLCSRSSSSAAASPSGTASAITPAPTIRLVPSAAHMRWSSQSAWNQPSVKPIQGVTVGKRLLLKVAAAMMPSGRNR